MKKTLATITLILAACAPANVTPVTVPLQYKPIATAIEYPAAQSCATVSRVDVTDTRAANSPLGVRALQENLSQKADVTSSGDVAAWLRGGAEAALKVGGVTMN